MQIAQIHHSTVVFGTLFGHLTWQSIVLCIVETLDYAAKNWIAFPRKERASIVFPSKLWTIIFLQSGTFSCFLNHKKSRKKSMAK